MAETEGSGTGSAIAFGLRLGKGLWRAVKDRGESMKEAFDKAGGDSARKRFTDSLQTGPFNKPGSSPAPEIRPDPVASRFAESPQQPRYSKNKPGKKISKLKWRVQVWLDTVDPLAFDAMMGVAQSGAMDPTGRLGQLRGSRPQVRSRVPLKQRGSVGYESVKVSKAEQNELDRLLAKGRTTDVDRLLQRPMQLGRQPSTRKGPSTVQSQTVRRTPQTSRARPINAPVAMPPGGGTPNGIDDIVRNARATRAGQVPIAGAGPRPIAADAVPGGDSATQREAARPQNRPQPSRSAKPGRAGSTARGVPPGPQLSYFPGFQLADAGARTQRGRARTAGSAPGQVPISATAVTPTGGGNSGCNCRSPSKKPRKPRKPRSVCYRGTYIENSRGLVKTRREQVPC